MPGLLTLLITENVLLHQQNYLRHTYIPLYTGKTKACINLYLANV